MPDLGARLPDRLVILQVAEAEAGVAIQPVPALLDELAGQLQVGAWPVSRYSSASAVSTIGWPSSPASRPPNVATR